MRMRLPAAALVVVALGMAALRAQSGAAPTDSSQAPASAQPKPPYADAGPVPVPQPSPLAMQRYRSGIVLWIVDNIWDFVLPGIILMTGFSARLRDWSVRVGRKWFFVIAIYFAVFSILTFVVDLPRAYYEEFVRDHAYGLSNQTFQKWASDSLISLVVGIIGGTLFLWIPYLLLRKSPRRWWLYTGLAAVPFLLLMIVVKPIWIDPLFNTFGPMKDKALESRILQLADRAGIAGGRVYEVDKSTDTNALNAYVTGFGATKRIVLWDTTIKRLDQTQLLFVMGHEMGHYVLGHMWKLVGMFAVVILLTLCGVHLTAGAVIRRYRARIGFDALGDIASLPLLLILFNLGFLIASPFALAYNRHVEHEADRFGLEITKTNHEDALAFVRLQQDNLANPNPHWLIKVFQYNHPTLAERIEFANTYRPWEHGEPLVYESHFK
jgi:Zn-dependent protease with chaperone function